ncbi:hypothetical protein JTE90_004502 [Oedothorax gibbosus]|uniref:Uncharacterized protein n=1 Tax=Oedothorax gibbosus TaxID=931172 RepID=A0AAV6U385_9ARAC|nr:hypothetical protein JTE90_004502 [Oedothorax gibbosus]
MFLLQDPNTDTTIPDSTEPVLRDTKPSTKDTPGSSQYTGPITTRGRSSSPASPDVSGVAPSNGNPAVPGLTQQSVPKTGSVPQLQSSAPNSIPGNSLPGQQTSPSSQPGGTIQSSSISSPTDGSSRYQPSNRPSDNIPALRSPEPQSSTISEPISNSQPNLKQPSPQSTTVDFKRAGSPPGTSPVDIHFAAQGGTDGTPNVSPNNQYVPTSGPQTPTPPSPDSTEPVLRDTKPSTKDTPGSSQYTGPITTQGRSSSPASPEVSGVAPSNGNPAVPGLTQQSVPKTGSVPQLQSSAPNSIPGNSLPGQQTSPSSQPGGSIQSSSISSPTDGSSRYQPSNRPSDNIPALRSPEPQSSTISEPISNSQPNLKQPSPQSTTVDFKRAGSPPGTSPVDIHFAAQGGTDGTPNVSPNNQYVPTSGPQTPTPPSPDSTEPVLRDTKPSTKDTPGSSQYTGPSTTQGRSSSPASPEVSGVAPFNGNPAVPGLTQQSVPKPGSVPQLQSSAPNSIPGNSLPGQQTSPSSQPGGGIQSSSISSPTDGSSRYQPSNRPSDNIPALRSPEPQSSTISEPISNSQPNLKQPSPQSTTVDFKRAGSPPGTSPVDIHFAAQGGTDGTPNVSPNNQYVPTSGPQTPTPPSPDSTEPVLRDTKPSTKDTPGSSQYTGPITTQGRSSSPASPDVSGVAPSNGNPAVPGLTQQSVPKTGSVPQLQSSAPNSIPGNSLPGQQTSPSSQPGGSIQFSSISSPTDGSSRYQPSNRPSDNIPALRSPEPQSSTISEPISNSQPNLKQPSPQSTTVDFKRAGSPPGTSPVDIHFAAQGGTDGTPNVSPNNQYVPTSGPQTPTPPSPDSTEPVLRDTKPSTKDTPGSSQYTGPITTQGRSSSPASPEVSGVAPSNGNPAVPGLTQQSVPKTGSVPQLQSSAPNSIPGNSLPGQQTSPSSQPGGSIQFSSISSPTDGSSRYQPSKRPSDNIPALRSPEPQSSTISEPISNSQPNLKQPSPQSTTVDFKRAGSPQGTSPVDIHFAAQCGTDGTPNISPNNQYVPTSGPQTPTPPSPDSTEPVLRDTKPSTKDTPGSSQYTGPITTQGSSSSLASPDVSGVAPSNGNPAVPGSPPGTSPVDIHFATQGGTDGTPNVSPNNQYVPTPGPQTPTPPSPDSTEPVLRYTKPSTKDTPGSSQYTGPITTQLSSSAAASGRYSPNIPGPQSAGSQNPYQSTPSSIAPVLGDGQPTTKGPGKDIGQAVPSSKSSQKDLPNTFQYTSPITTPESSTSPVSPDLSGVAPANANPTVPGRTEHSASKIGSAPQIQSSTPNSTPENSQPEQQTSSSSQPGDSIQSSSIHLPTDDRSRYQPSNAPSDNLEAPSVSSKKDAILKIINNLQKFINNRFNCLDFRNFANDLLRKLSTRNIIEESNCCKRKDFIEDSLLSALKNIPMYSDNQ